MFLEVCKATIVSMRIDPFLFYKTVRFEKTWSGIELNNIRLVQV